MESTYRQSGASAIGLTSGLAGATALLLGQTTQAALVLTTAPAGAHTAVSPSDTGTFHTVRLDLNGDGTIDMTFMGPSWEGVYNANGNPFGIVVTTTSVGGSDYAKRLTNTAGIPTEPLWESLTRSHGEQIWTSGGQGWTEWSQGHGLLGIWIGNSVVHDYYWVEITPDTSTDPIPGTSYTINGWGAVGTFSGSGSGSGGGVGGSGTPEPTASGLALLALGAAGVMRKRRRELPV